jgi:hypothetical protein
VMKSHTFVIGESTEISKQKYKEKEKCIFSFHKEYKIDKLKI